ncbi:hypothetical protein PSPO01_00655 [Paraphaeosphaeria sporulosa]
MESHDTKHTAAGRPLIVVPERCAVLIGHGNPNRTSSARTRSSGRSNRARVQLSSVSSKTIPVPTSQSLVPSQRRLSTSFVDLMGPTGGL